jgi:hypothetical protein
MNILRMDCKCINDIFELIELSFSYLDDALSNEVAAVRWIRKT